MTVVIVTEQGVLAGGSAGPELGDRHARLWQSAEGTDWQAIPDSSGFDGAEVADILPSDDGYVAIGRLGTGQRPTGSIVWVSRDAETWQRVNDPALEDGLAVSLTSAPQTGLVAVGSDLDEREAVAWTSADGRSWQRAPREESRLHSGEKIRMTDVVSSDGELVAVGNYVGVQFGTAASWVSPDGTHWKLGASHPALEQGEMLSIVRNGPGFVATGSFGAPDNYVPTIWLSPPRA
jgi:hypothetical protein